MFINSFVVVFVVIIIIYFLFICVKGYGVPSSRCLNGHCLEIFKIKEGDECYPDSTDDIYDYMHASFQCEVGLSCAPSGNKTICMKVNTTLDCQTECSADSDCPVGAYCGCDSSTGTTKCRPYPYSDKDVFKELEIIYKYDFDSCEFEINYCRDFFTAYKNYKTLVGQKYFPGDYVKCADKDIERRLHPLVNYSVIGSDSGSKTDFSSGSNVVQAIAALLALFF